MKGIKFSKKFKVFMLIALFFCSAILTILCMSQFDHTRNVEQNMVTIRVPGEFEGEAVVLYNSAYVSQSKQDSVITLKFQKPGYYHISILNEDILFCNFPEENEAYDVDLIRQEYNQIQKNRSVEWIGVLCFEGVIFGVLLFLLLNAPFKAKKEKQIDEANY